MSSWLSTYQQALCALTNMFPAFLATPAPLRAVNTETLPLILYAGELASVVLPFLWLRGIEQLGPSRCAVFIKLLPVMTAGVAIAMLGEPVKSYHLIGGRPGLGRRHDRPGFAPLGFHAVDQDGSRSVRTAWQFIQSVA